MFLFPETCAHSSRKLPSQGTVTLPLPDVQTLPRPLLTLLCSHPSAASGLVGLGRERKSSHCSDSSKRIRSRTNTT